MADALNFRLNWRPDLASISSSAAPAATNFTIDATNDSKHFIFAAENTEAITHLGFRYGARVGTPCVQRVSLQSLAGGPPQYGDGTVLGGGSPASATFTPPADATWNGTWQWIALTNSYTPTRGQLLALVIDYSSGTVNGSNSSSYTYAYQSGSLVLESGMPYSVQLNAGSPSGSAYHPPFGIRTANTRYGRVFYNTWATRGALTTGHRIAMKFNLPTQFGSTYTIRGFEFLGSITNNQDTNNILAGLWSASALIQGVNCDSRRFYVHSNSYSLNRVLFDESSLTALTTGTTYYLGFEVLGASRQALISGSQLTDANDRLAYPWGTAVNYATYNTSVWTDDTTVVPWVFPIIDDVTGVTAGISNRANIIQNIGTY